jgi:hypothetical protein
VDCWWRQKPKEQSPNDAWCGARTSAYECPCVPTITNGGKKHCRVSLQTSLPAEPLLAQTARVAG